MASRGGQCPGRGKISRPALTRAQMLRAAQTSAVVQQREAAAGASCPPQEPRAGPSRQSVARRSPKKVDYAAPQMTKALAMRKKAAEEKIRALDLAKQKADAAAKRRPRRTLAPIGGDARMGRVPRTAPRTAPAKTPEAQIKVIENAIAKGTEAAERTRTQADQALDAAIARGHIVTERTGAMSKRRIPGPSGLRGPRPVATGTAIPEETRQLARLMNADVVQATPISDGPVDKIIIDPGAVQPDRSTIVCIPPASPDRSLEGAVGGIANKSLQAIKDTLDEQDAVESAEVQNKLEDLQSARREFVMAVANVSANAVQGADDSILNIDEVPDQLEYLPSPPRSRPVYNVPDVSHVMFQVQYGRDHPDLEAARQFSRRTQMTLDEIQSQKRVEDEFERVAHQQIAEFDLEVPLEQQLQEGDISLEEDEYGTIIACPSRIKASMRVPRRETAVPTSRGANIEELERFFDVERYPPQPPSGPVAPPGREALNPDLWGLEDPWYHEPIYDDPPLIQFDSGC